MPQVRDDQKDLLRAFNENGVEYLVVGGHAVSHHSEPRTTKDLKHDSRSAFLDQPCFEVSISRRRIALMRDW